MEFSPHSLPPDTETLHTARLRLYDEIARLRRRGTICTALRWFGPPLLYLATIPALFSLLDGYALMIGMAANALLWLVGGLAVTDSLCLSRCREPLLDCLDELDVLSYTDPEIQPRSFSTLLALREHNPIVKTYLNMLADRGRQPVKAEVRMLLDAVQGSPDPDTQDPNPPKRSAP